MARLQVSATHHAALDRWREADWPLVVRQQESDCPSHTVCLGLALPPDAVSGIKHRLPLRLERGAISRYQNACSLREVLPVLSEIWRDQLARLATELAAAGLAAQVFGSAALQALTGLRYLHENSDIDLLLHPASTTQLDTALRCFGHYSTDLPLDGEIVFPCGAGVAIREWRVAVGTAVAARVLAKRHGGVALLRTDHLRASLALRQCMH